MDSEIQKKETMISSEAEQRELPKQKRSYWEFGVFVAVVVILVAVVGVLSFLLIRSFAEENKDKASIQAIVEEAGRNGVSEDNLEDKVEISKKAEEPKPAAAKEVDPLTTSIKIFNGGAVGGSAGKVKEILVAKGYKKIEAGNSEKSSYVGVTVFYQAEMKAVAEKVAADLKAQYPTVQIKIGTSAEEKSGLVVIILGK